MRYKSYDKPSRSGFEDSAGWCFEKLQFLRDLITSRKSTSSMPKVLLPVNTFEEIGENSEELEASLLIDADPEGKKQKVKTDTNFPSSCIRCAIELKCYKR